MKRLGILMVLGLFVLSSVAFAYSAGPAKISGNLGESVQAMEMKYREDRFRNQCYFTSEGAICPALTPSSNALLRRQKIHKISGMPGRSEVDFQRVTIREVRNPKAGISRSRFVTSITGSPGAFSRWSKRKRNVKNICYFSAEKTSKGNLVCPSFVSDIGKNPQSFRPSILFKPSLERLGKEEIVDLNPDRVDVGHDLAPYKLS